MLWRGKRSIGPLAWAIARSDVALSWFALDHAWAACRLARILKRRSAVIVGGIDAANRPDFDYGVFLNPAMARRTRYALARSDRVLVVDSFLRDEIRRNARIDRPDIVTVPTGYDVDHFRPDGGLRRNVLTVGLVEDTNLRRKGLTTFVEAARLLPEYPFVLVGARDNAATDRLRATAPPNLRLLPHLSDEQLLEEYRRARVYVQASLYEGLPNSLAEAMACGCVPVGTRIAGIPTLIGDAGFYVPPEDPKATAAAIRRAHEEGDSGRVRARIVESFPLERRRQALIEIVVQLVHETRSA